MHAFTVEIPHIKQLNVKRSKMCFKEEIFPSRGSYVTTSLAKIIAQLTAEANKHVKAARESIICQFAMIETKIKKQEAVQKSSGEQPQFAAEDLQVVYPVFVVNVDEMKCRALLDTGGGIERYVWS